MNEIEKKIIIVILVLGIGFMVICWSLAHKCVQLEAQIKAIRIETNFLTGSLERDLELLKVNLIRLKKGQW